MTLRSIVPVVVLSLFAAIANGQTVNDDVAVTQAGVAVDIDVGANDSGNWVSGSFTQPANGTVTTPNGLLLRYTPDAGFVGVDTFTYSLMESGGPPLTATVTVTVESVVGQPTFTDVSEAAGITHLHHNLMPDPVNFPGGPYALKDLITTTVNTPVAINVVLNDVGSWVNGSWQDPANGIVALGTGGQLTYTPDAGFEGTDSFDYTLDEAGGSSFTATVVINVVVDAAPGRFLMTEFLNAGAAAGDYDDDGDEDLYVTILDGPDILYRNNGDGTFTDAAATAGIDRGDGSSGAAWADIDNDGDLDLYVTAVLAYRYYLYINNGDGTFTEDAVARGAAVEGDDTHYGMSVSFGDYDADGYLDIHLCEWRLDMTMNLNNALSNSRLLRNLGAANPGNFEDVTAAAGVALDDVFGDGTTNPNDGTFSFSSRFTDLDNDGNLDLAIAADFGESRLFWNNGDGTFTDGTIAAGVGGDENGMGSTVADVNGDGLQDWFVTAISGNGALNHSGNRLYLNNGDRTFTDSTDTAGVRDGFWGWGATFFDYDNDGDQDLTMVNGVDFPVPNNEEGFQNDPMRLWRNDGTGVFLEISASAGLVDAFGGKGILSFDYDSDGDLDLLVTNNGGTPHGGVGRGKAVLYRNDGGNDNDWIRVTTSGSIPGAGARVTLTASPGANPQVQEIYAGNNFMSQNPSIAHFGLGTGTNVVHEVQIEWPDGTVQTQQDVARNSTVSFTHP